MKKFLIVIVILAAIGYGIYYFGTNVASDKMVDTFTNNLEDSGQMDEVRTIIENDPELLSMMEEENKDRDIAIHNR
jgi:hypothetical protein